MCGIFCYLNKKDKVEENYLKELSNKSFKRGPESFSFKKMNETIYFGFNRLAINGLNTISDQPLYYKKMALICNGEIFNYKELIETYNLEVSTQSDCEVILHLYERFGYESFSLLKGEYSFIIYDNSKLVVCRDPFGIRPLYVNENKDGIIFSSVLTLNKNDNNIKQFEPGTYSVYELDGTINTDGQYYNIHNISTHYNSEYECRKKTYELLCESVHKRIRTSEREVGCLLSGGLDSSLIAAISSRYYKEQGKQLKTFSIGMIGSEDLYFAKKVANYIGSDHKEFLCDTNEFLDSIKDVISDIESYDTTTIRASVGNWLIGKKIKEVSDCKVILNGDGADELMGGYLYFNLCQDNNEFDKECKRLLNNIHYFDVLRSDRSISSHGLEPRTPFLDNDFVSFYMSIPIYYRKQKKVEKEFIRNTIQEFDIDLLPYEVLWRQKEAFSDGVSNITKSWFQIIQERLQDYKSIHCLEENLTNEQKYFKDIFINLFEQNTDLIPYYWMPKYSNTNDPSARTLSIYNNTTFYKYINIIKEFFSVMFVKFQRKFC